MAISGQYEYSWLLRRGFANSRTLCWGTRHPLNYWDQCKMKVWRRTRVERRNKKGATVTLERTERKGESKKMKRRGILICYLFFSAFSFLFWEEVLRVQATLSHDLFASDVICCPFFKKKIRNVWVFFAWIPTFLTAGLFVSWTAYIGFRS